MAFNFASFFSTAVLAFPILADASFLRDVAGRHHQNKPAQKEAIEDALFAKAVPLSEYRSKMRSQGLVIGERDLEDADGDDQYSNNNGYDDDFFNNGWGANQNDDAYNNNDDQQNGDDYVVQYKRNFNGYSLKYAKCQPVQRFSEEAIEAGEFSPMLTDDIVILRLCPSDTCNTKNEYGCSSNYAEYAIGLTDYVRIMLYFKKDHIEQLCDWCDACYARRDLEQSNYNYGNDDDCSDYKSHCYDEDTGYSICEQYKGNDQSAYFDYLDCEQVKDGNGNAWYVRPRCDGYNQIIHMGVFWDNMCSYHAEDEMTVSNLGLGIDDDVFEEMYSGMECMDCQRSYSPPYFYSPYTLCNRMHKAGAACTKNLQDYYLQLDEDESVCYFMQSMRYGNYDEVGELTHGLGGMKRQVTESEKAGLVISTILVVLLIAYATYLHHKITDLIDESMAKQELLPSKKKPVVRKIQKIKTRRNKSSEKRKTGDKSPGRKRDERR